MLYKEISDKIDEGYENRIIGSTVMNTQVLFLIQK